MEHPLQQGFIKSKKIPFCAYKIPFCAHKIPFCAHKAVFAFDLMMRFLTPGAPFQDCQHFWEVTLTYLEIDIHWFQKLSKLK